VGRGAGCGAGCEDADGERPACEPAFWDEELGGVRSRGVVPVDRERVDSASGAAGPLVTGSLAAESS
jgi:hypothetical protein